MDILLLKMSVNKCYEENRTEQGDSDASGKGERTMFNCVIRTHLPIEETSDPGAECYKEEPMKNWEGCSEKHQGPEEGRRLMIVRKSRRSVWRSSQSHIMERPLHFFKV